MSLIRSDAIALPLADESVDLIVTSPPYFALRSYTDGGEHYDGQIGSEATPAEFLEALWAVTAECRRVLKPSGSMFVNLGDSYAGSGGYNNSAIGADGRGPSSYRRNRRGISTEGAEAQWTEANAAWLAGVVDSDGSMSVRQFSTGEGRSDSFVGWVRIGQMRPEVVERAAEVTGVGRVYQDKRGVWNWHVASQQAAYVLRRIWPWLYIKHRQALAIIELCRHIADVGASGGRKLTHNDLAYRASLREAVQDWNQGRPNDLEPPKVPRPTFNTIDPRAKSLHGLPWRYAIGCIDDLDLILRAEVVWSKPNGLPESVTDRVRRSHEQWFHFTKEPRYYSAVDEVREPHAHDEAPGARRGPSGQNRGTATGRTHDDGGSVGNFAHDPLGKLPGSVWTIPSEPLKVPTFVDGQPWGSRPVWGDPKQLRRLWGYAEHRHSIGQPAVVWECDHYAAFPQEWPRRLILGWSPPGICVACGEGRRPVVDATPRERFDGEPKRHGLAGVAASGAVPSLKGGSRAITGYACACDDTSAPTRPAVVLDPFGGTGTTSMVARALGRYGVNVDLSADYLRLARWRIFESGHASKTIERTNREAQGTLL